MSQPLSHLRTTDPDPAEAVVQAFRRISRAIERHSHALAGRYGLTVPQLGLLKRLEASGGLSVGVLTQGAHLSQATVTGILDRLERRGLVERRRGQADKRKVHVYLTQAGQATLRHAPPLLHETFLEAFGRLQDWEQTQILSSLQRVVAMMEAEPVDRPRVAPPSSRQQAVLEAEPLDGAASTDGEPDASEPD